MHNSSVLKICVGFPTIILKRLHRISLVLKIVDYTVDLSQ
jgi:hypothetical protein